MKGRHSDSSGEKNCVITELFILEVEGSLIPIHTPTRTFRWWLVSFDLIGFAGFSRCLNEGCVVPRDSSSTALTNWEKGEMLLVRLFVNFAMLIDRDETV